MARNLRKPFARALLKVTGECFTTPEKTAYLADELLQAAGTGCALAIVVGGGNFIRGRETRWLDRIAADQAGMLVTVANALVLQNLLEQRQVATAHYSALEIPGIVRRFSTTAACRELTGGRILLLSGGTGNPLFSTDSAAVLRAVELNTDVVLKGTKVTGIYSADPKQNPEARFLSRLTYRQALRSSLQIMDATAFALLAEHRIPLIVFDFFQPGNLAGIMKGERIGSIVC